MTMEIKCHISRGISHEDLHSEGIFQPATFDCPKALSYGAWTRFHLSAPACCCKYLAAAALSRSSPAGGQASRNWRRPTSARTFLSDGCPQKLNGYNKGWGLRIVGTIPNLASPTASACAHFTAKLRGHPIITWAKESSNCLWTNTLPATLLLCAVLALVHSYWSKKQTSFTII